MRVVSIIDSLTPGGTERSVADVLPVVASLGAQVLVVQLVDRGGFRRQLVAQGVPVHTLRSVDRLKRIRELRRLLTQVSPDLVHTQLFEADLIGRSAAASARIPVVSSLVNIAYGSEHATAPGMRRHRLRLAQFADASTAQLVRSFHAVSGSVRSTMARRLLIPRGRITVIPRGRVASRLGRNTEPRRRRVRETMGIDERTPVILAVGRHEWQKGLDVLLEAMPVIGQPSAGLVLVAGRQGAQTPLLEGIVANRRPSGWQISFLGARDDVADLLVAADVLAFPSRWEGLPGTLIEALALETPVVATDIAPVAEVVAGLPGVRLVPPDEPDALANALRAALSGRPVDVTGHRDRFQRRYEITAVAQRTLEFYEAALR